MRLYVSLLLCVSLGGTSSGAMAAGGNRYGFCTSGIPGSAPMPHHTYNTNYPAHISGVLDFGEGSADRLRAAERQFAQSLGPKRNATCQRYTSTVKEAREGLQRQLEVNAGYDVATGWTGEFGAAEEGNKRESASPGGFHITVEDNGIAARLAAWEDRLLQAKREEAAAKVKKAIATVQSKAEYARILAKAKADAKKRGRVQ